MSILKVLSSHWALLIVWISISEAIFKVCEGVLAQTGMSGGKCEGVLAHTGMSGGNVKVYLHKQECQGKNHY